MIQVFCHKYMYIYDNMDTVLLEIQQRVSVFCTLHVSLWWPEVETILALDYSAQFDAGLQYYSL